MIAIDTNVLVRIILDDDAAQVAASLRLFQSGEPVYMLNSVLLETAWVLKSRYAVPVADIADALEAVLREPYIVTEAPLAIEAIDWYRNGMDFADAIHLAGAASRCERLATFDGTFIRKAKGKARCVVGKPG